jgi:hypothetical protein
MKMKSQKTNKRIWFCAAIGVALMLLAIWPQGVAAQSNTFPTNGNAGIGTTTPSNKLEISGTDSGTLMKIKSTVGAYPVVQSGGTTHDATWLFLDGTNSAYIGLMNASVGSGVFSAAYYGGASRISVLPGGNVGIGTSTPTSKLQVAGDSNVTGNLTVGGNIAAKYQDVAEWVESSQSLPAGTVVVLDHTKSNQVIASSQAYDTRVAGVISATPGIALGEDGQGKVLVATTGRVKLRVNATQASIQVGDLLVTSDTEGMAMKSMPINIGGVQIHRPGALVGKALEPLAKGEGEILVLLSLQ